MKALSWKNILLFSLVGLVAGCATDPLTRLLKENRFAPITPIPEIQNVGDVYKKADLRSNPVVLIRDVFSQEVNEKLMNSLKGGVQLPSISGEQQFSLGVTPDIIGYVHGELNALHVKKFRLKLAGAYQYIISEDRLTSELLPALKKQRPALQLSDKFVVLALLQVSMLEYELLDEKGTKIEVTPGGEIEKVIKAKLSSEWKANEQRNLTIDHPCFLGYRVGEIIEVGSKIEVKSLPVEDTARAKKTVIKEIPTRTLRMMQRSQ
ncbi:MAG: hypothetical protein NTU54_01120 [Candidatus Omnitrophica bacterium]|nr:hypothetical protein [Candidatus Omnitrophota bacterium]